MHARPQSYWLALSSSRYGWSITRGFWRVNGASPIKQQNVTRHPSSFAPASGVQDKTVIDVSSRSFVLKAHKIDEVAQRFTKMQTAIIFDCEFLVTENAQRRFWCGPYDPDPIIAQIGAVKISLDSDSEIVETLRTYIKPIDRHGDPYELDPFFTKLTGITPETIDAEGVSLLEANEQLRDFASDAKLWSWGKDELNMMAISCYIAGVEPCLPAHRFDNACRLLLASGMSYEDLLQTRSSALADYFEIEHPPLRGHDALDDALSIAYVIQHLLREKKLSKSDFV